MKFPDGVIHRITIGFTSEKLNTVMILPAEYVDIDPDYAALIVDATLAELKAPQPDTKFVGGLLGSDDWRPATPEEIDRAVDNQVHVKLMPLRT